MHLISIPDRACRPSRSEFPVCPEFLRNSCKYWLGSFRKTARTAFPSSRPRFHMRTIGLKPTTQTQSFLLHSYLFLCLCLLVLHYFCQVKCNDIAIWSFYKTLSFTSSVGDFYCIIISGRGKGSLMIRLVDWSVVGIMLIVRLWTWACGCNALRGGLSKRS